MGHLVSSVNNSAFSTRIILILEGRKRRLRDVKELAQVTEQRSWSGHGRQRDSEGRWSTTVYLAPLETLIGAGGRLRIDGRKRLFGEKGALA